jgi:hypothetical protein
MSAARDNSKDKNGKSRRRRRRSRSEAKKMPKVPREIRVYMPPKPELREYEPCPVSGEPIDNIYVAIADPDSGKPCRFDKIIERLARREELKDNQRVAYIGAGNFAVIEEVVKDRRKSYEVVKKIPYEDTYQKNQWRRELSPGISRDYVPQPEPLDNLYTTEEIMNFPKLGAASTASYMPRTN